jgi:Ca2+-binding RTX toxin-like protein
MPIHRKPRAIAPAGTNGRDILDATADGQTLHGLGGRDRIRSAFDGTSLFGDAGYDRLVTRLSLADQPDALARQFGGAGNDVLNARVRIEGGDFDPATQTSTEAASEIVQNGGAGDDRITAHSYALGFGIARATNTVNGGSGHDVINVKAEIDYWSAPQKSYATNVVSGGAGNDRITAEATGDYSGSDSYSTNRIDGGAGDDLIDATAHVRSNGGFHALNDIKGGAGDDQITASASAFSNSSTELVENVIDGGDGNDRIAVTGSVSSTFAKLRMNVVGGDGDDVITARNRSALSEGSDTRARIDGGDGDDRIDSSLEYGPLGPDAPRIVHRVNGDDGDDRIAASIVFEPSGEGSASAINRLDGGVGDDEMTGIVTGLGRSNFDGGSGRDVLRVDGGQNNLLSGGGGLDRLFAGSGTDRLLGGGSADDFVFDVTEDQGADRLLDFEGDLDRLCFTGLADTGAPGLADDLDAISTVVDQGAGLDVIVTFNAGTVLTFEGCGLGSDFIGDPLIDSLADLVENARTQLVVEPL